MNGYENLIFYDRRFLKMGEMYVPLVQIGNTRTYECNNLGKRIIHKHWEILGFRNHKILLFTEAELRTWFSEPQFKDFHRKNVKNYHWDFQKWMTDGIKGARSVEDNYAAGNELAMSVKGDGGSFVIEFRTEAEFYYLVNEYSTINGVGFQNRDYNTLKNVIPPEDIIYGFYTISVITHKDYYIYDLSGMTKELDIAKKFKSETEALDYMGECKNKKRHWGMTVKYIAKSEYLKESRYK